MTPYLCDFEQHAELPGGRVRYRCERCGYLSVPLPADTAVIRECHGRWRAGDWLAWILKKVGIKACGGCERRRRILNSLLRRAK